MTISTSGVPQRLKSTSVAVAPWMRPDCRNVHVLRGVLLEVRAHDADRQVAVLARDRRAAVRAQRLVVLADLVRLRIVGVEVVLAVEDRTLGDRAVEREAELDRLLDRTAVRHRQRAGERRGTPGTSCVFGRRAELVRAAAEHLRLGLQLDVDLEPDHWLPGGAGHDRYLVGTAVERERALERVRRAEKRVLGELRADRAAGRPAARPRARTGR